MAASSEGQETAVVDVGCLLDAGAGTLVTLVAGGTQLEAHRAILAAGSPVFAAMFSHDTLEASTSQVEIPDVEGPVLRQLLSYLYTLQAPQLPTMASQLLVAADKYGVVGLKVQCEYQLVSQLRVENAVDMAVLAMRYSCPFLKEAAFDFIAANPQMPDTQAWAEAAHNYPRYVTELIRLSAKMKIPTAGYKIPIFNPPPDFAAVALMRRLSQEGRIKRMFVAAQMGAVEELKALIEAGVNIHSTDEDFYRMTALHWAAARGHAEVARCLIQAGAQVNSRDSMWCTPLHHSAYRGHIAVVRLLLEASADPNARNQWKRTPLHDAEEQGHTEVVAALRQAAADRRSPSWTLPLGILYDE